MMCGLTVSAPPDGNASYNFIQSKKWRSLPRYMVAGTALDVNSSSCDGFSPRAAIMDAAMDGTAIPVA
jgi:hypothetical protein